VSWVAGILWRVRYERYSFIDGTHFNTVELMHAHTDKSNRGAASSAANLTLVALMPSGLQTPALSKA
jgi:hypothetical protein